MLRALLRARWLLVLLLVGVTADLHAKKVESITLQLDGDHQFRYAGFYAAIWNGYYRRVGLDVQIRSAFDENGTDIDAIRSVVDGDAHFGLSGAELLLAKDRGDPVAVLAVILQRNSVALYTDSPEHALTPVELASVHILPTADQALGLSYQLMQREFNERIRSGVASYNSASSIPNGIQATLGDSLLYPYESIQADRDVQPLKLLHHRADLPGSSIFTTRDLLDQRPELVEAFVVASIEGWQYALQNSDEVAMRLTRERMAVGRYRDMFGINFYQIDKVRELTMYPIVPLGNNSTERWERAYNQLRKAGLVSRPFSADDFVHDPIQNLKHRAERTERWIKHGLLMLGSFLLLASTAYWCYWIQQRKVAARLQREANYDALTGLPNRTSALRNLSSAIARQRSHSQTVSAFFIDLDGFKRVNDTFGHYIGDLLLCAAATRLNNLCVSQSGRRECFHVSRLGGDEFLLIAKDLTFVEIKSVAESILGCMSQVFNLAGKELHIGASIGIATVWRGTISRDALLQRADAAMYLAKTSGRNQYRIYDSGLGRALLEKNTIEEQLAHAVGERELLLNYQPIIAVESGRMVGAEVLLRWHNDKLGQVAPDRFIPVAEESGLIGEIGLWVLDTALQQQSRWQQQFDADLELAINLSPKQFSAGFYDRLQASALAAGVRPETVKLEITEGLLASSNAETTALLQRIAVAGYQLSIDDFGTGYSSLNYLRTFPASTLKIDRSFVSQLTDHRNQALVTAIVKMAHSLGLSVVAEGIETEQQEMFLRQQQCDYLQGYRYGKPVTAEAFSQLLSIEAGRANGDVVPMQRRVISAASKTMANAVAQPVSASLV